MLAISLWKKAQPCSSYIPKILFRRREQSHKIQPQPNKGICTNFNVLRRKQVSKEGWDYRQMLWWGILCLRCLVWSCWYSFINGWCVLRFVAMRHQRKVARMEACWCSSWKNIGKFYRTGKWKKNYILLLYISCFSYKGFFKISAPNPPSWGQDEIKN